MAVYFPYFRGKQYELVAVRESAATLAAANFVPIIEPVKKVMSGLRRALEALEDAGGEVVVILNPSVGDFSGEATQLATFLRDDFPEVGVGLRVDDRSTASDLADKCGQHVNDGRRVTLIHAEVRDGRPLAAALGDLSRQIRHVFVEAPSVSLIYRRHFDQGERILLADAFERMANRNYPDEEVFSALHLVYNSAHNMSGFGDFLMVGDDYSESGGPAYAVAIHLTCIDPEREDQMFIKHFKSDTVDTPTDPAGKFAQALRKLVAEVGRPGSPIYRSSAVREFLDLHERRHFPGLGYVKKLSMIHHIETYQDFFQRE